ncbi:MAG TPA: P-loop NTPase fold protein, partial [Anaerolineaceae bacterium]|nr:P-loop NTPase fold protein [Anaerolineaceae bacterium]
MTQPTQYLSDYRSDKDLLDFSLFRPALLEIVQNASTPLTLGVFGSWGTGKTSLLYQLMSEIASTGNPHQRVVWFTAWKYEQQDALWRAFLLRVIDGLYPHKKENERYPLDELKDENQRAGAEYLDRLERSIYENVSWTESGEWRFNTLELVKQGIRLPIWLAFQLAGQGDAAKDLGITPELAKLLEREAREHHLNQLNSLERFAAEFEKAAQLILGKEGRLIVFVDDLDRCLPEKAVQILEAIKLFMDVPGVVFVLGMDREIVRRGIETYYGAMLKGEKGMDAVPINGDSYLQKMVQIPFYLPPLPDNGRGKFIDELLGTASHLDALTRQVFSVGVFPTPRQIKRVLNIFFLLRQIADEQERRELISKGDVLNPLLAKTVLIQSQWPELYQEWRQHPGLIQALEDYYVQNPLSEDEHLFGREVAEIPGDADLPLKNEERSTVRPARKVLATGLMSPYVNDRQKYALLGALLCYPPDRNKPDWAQCHFTGLTLKQLNNYIGLVGALESARQVQEASLPEGLLAEIQSGDAALLKTLIARVRDVEPDPNGQQHKRLRQQLLQAMQDGTNPAPNRAAVGAALSEIGDPRFRPDAFYLPDDPLLGFI